MATRRYTRRKRKDEYNNQDEYHQSPTLAGEASQRNVKNLLSIYCSSYH